MKNNEAVSVVERLIKLFPSWKPDKVEKIEWLNTVRTLSFASGIDCVSELFKQCPYPRPSMPMFIAISQKSTYALAVKAKGYTPVEYFKIVKPGMSHGITYWGKPNPDMEHLKNYAELIKHECYPDREIVYLKSFIPDEELSECNCG